MSLNHRPRVTLLLHLKPEQKLSFFNRFSLSTRTRFCLKTRRNYHRQSESCVSDVQMYPAKRMSAWEATKTEFSKLFTLGGVFKKWRFHRIRVDGRPKRKKKTFAFSHENGYSWTRPKTNNLTLSLSDSISRSYNFICVFNC